MISRQIAAEGVSPIVAVVDEKEALAGLAWAPGTTIPPREDLDAVQRELREKKGVSAIIYVQTCATEKHPRRSRKEIPHPATRNENNSILYGVCPSCVVHANGPSVKPRA